MSADKMLMKIRLTPTPIIPMRNDGDIDITSAVAISLRNAGTATVNLWNGMWTLDSKEVLSMDVTEIGGWLDLLNIPVSFDTGTGSEKLLQIIILKATLC